MTHLTAATAVRASLPTFAIAKVISKHGHAIGTQHISLCSSIYTLEITISRRVLLSRAACHARSAILVDVRSEIILGATHLWVMIISSSIVFVETWDWIRYICKLLAIYKSLWLSMSDIMLRRNVRVEIRSRDMLHCVILWRISMTSLCGTHQIVASESRLVSCNHSWSWVAHVVVLLPAYRISSHRWSTLVLVDNTASIYALALSPIWFLIFVKTR